MAEREEFETLVYCLGQVGGEHNPVITSGSAFDTKYEYTTKGYKRYIKEANNVIKFMNHVISHFLESVKSEFEEDPLAFIDSESEDDMLAAIQKMKKQWKEMFKEHQKKLREALQNQTLEESSSSLTQSIEESSGNRIPSIEETSEHGDEDSSKSSSSAKVPKLDTQATSETFEIEPEEEISEADTEIPESDSEATSKTSSVGVPVENLEFPESVFIQRLKDFGRVLKAAYQELRAKLGKALDQIVPDHTAHDLKGFTLQRMEKFAKWKYTLKTLGHLVSELESKFGELDLDFNKRKENEKRLTDWLYFDDGKRDRKYHHRLLIPMELTVSIDEISAIIYKQIRRYRKMAQSLENKLPEDYSAFNEKVADWKYLVLYGRPVKRPVRPTRSTQSDDTYCGVDEMPVD